MLYHRRTAAQSAIFRSAGNSAQNRAVLTLGNRHCESRKLSVLLNAADSRRIMAQLMINVHIEIFKCRRPEVLVGTTENKLVCRAQIGFNEAERLVLLKRSIAHKNRACGRFHIQIKLVAAAADYSGGSADAHKRGHLVQIGFIG